MTILDIVQGTEFEESVAVMRGFLFPRRYWFEHPITEETSVEKIITRLDDLGLVLLDAAELDPNEHNEYVYSGFLKIKNIRVK